MNNANRVKKQRNSVKEEVLRLQVSLLKETNKLADESFEMQFLNSAAFRGLCFLVIAYQNVNASESFLEEVLSLMNIPEETLLTTIQEFFAIHDSFVPSSLLKVVEQMSKLLE